MDAPLKPSSQTPANAPNAPMSSSIALDLVPPADAQTDFAALDESRGPAALSGAVQHLPVAIQAAFRRKLFAIFALQLGFVLAVVATIRWLPSLRDAWASALDGNVATIAIPLGALLLLLLALYVLRAKLPWNWLLLVLFSVATSFVYAGFDVLVDTSVGVVFCGAAFAWALLMTAFAGVLRRQSASRHQDELLSPRTAGAISYVITAAATAGLWGIFGDGFVSSLGLFAVLVLLFVATAWFVHNATKTLGRLTPDEYMLGVVYFYVDILAVLAMAALGFAGGNSGLLAVYSAAPSAVAQQEEA